MGNQGTPAGMSYYSGWAGCPRRATLNERAKDAGDSGEESGTAAKLGTEIHARLEAFYSGAALYLPDVAVEQEIRDKAAGIIEAYYARFGRDLGEILEVEQMLPRPVLSDPAGTPYVTMGGSFFDPDDLSILSRAVGIEPFSCRPDMVCRPDPTEVKRTRGIDIEPGVWIVDHKSSGRHDAMAALRWAGSMQLRANYFTWNALAKAYGHEPAVGVLVNAIYTTKVPDFETFAVRPSEDDRLELHRYLAGVAEIKNGPLATWANPTHCFDWFRCCPHLLSGTCAGFKVGA